MDAKQNVIVTRLAQALKEVLELLPTLELRLSDAAKAQVDHASMFLPEVLQGDLPNDPVAAQLIAIALSNALEATVRAPLPEELHLRVAVAQIEYFFGTPRRVGEARRTRPSNLRWLSTTDGPAYVN